MIYPAGRERNFVMETEYESHSDTLNRIKPLLEQIDPKDIANAFLFSLSTRKLEYRSALGSFYYAKAVPEHEFMDSYNEFLAAAAYECYLCGWRAQEFTTNGLRKNFCNEYNEDRCKYGGSIIGQIHINYALYDLEQFIKLPKVVPTDRDRQIFMEILSCVDRLKSTDKAGKLRDTIIKAKIFKSNRDEVAVLLGELGVCGILAGKDFPSYDVYFPNEYERDPTESKSYFAYPVNRWRARDGINIERLKAVFGFESIS